MRHPLACLALLLSVVGATGCNPAVQPWQRETLARPAMELEHPFDTRYDEHLYFSREASSGGQGFSAGGCGCN